MFPFLAIKSNLLFYYRRTRAIGYEYYSIIDDQTFIQQTKRKFDQFTFKVSSKVSQQAVFWTDVLPATNPKNGIRANIPTEGISEFVGRQKQISKIRREIIEIPNQNGIVYGLGGVGKTALMIQTSHKLVEEDNRDEILFDNIIWVSAKRNYYDTQLDRIEPEKMQFDSLDKVIAAILDFFEFGDLEAYCFEDKKELLLEASLYPNFLMK